MRFRIKDPNVAEAIRLKPYVTAMCVLAIITAARDAKLGHMGTASADLLAATGFLLMAIALRRIIPADLAEWAQAGQLLAPEQREQMKAFALARKDRRG